METGSAARPFLGVTLVSVDSSNAAELGVKTESGAYIESVQPGSPAEQAGLQAGDVVTSIGNTNVNTSAELIIEIRKCEIGSTVKLGINRNGESLFINVVLGSITD